jgi:hypothetical protein
MIDAAVDILISHVSMVMRSILATLCPEFKLMCPGCLCLEGIHGRSTMYLDQWIFHIFSCSFGKKEVLKPFKAGTSFLFVLLKTCLFFSFAYSWME